MMVYFFDSCWNGWTPKVRKYRNGSGRKVFRIDWLKYVFELHRDWNVV